MREAAEMSSPTSDYYAAPIEDNLFEWHFTVRGPEETDFKGGVYHGRIIVPAEYPMKPPDIILLTPNGRFEVGKKICLSISGYHPETWQPSWSIRTALLAIIGFMPTPGQGTIGSLDYTADERKALARRSVDWCCKECGQASSLLLPPSLEENEKQRQEVEEIVKNVAFKGEEVKEREKENKSTKPPSNLNPSASSVSQDLANQSTSSTQHLTGNIEESRNENNQDQVNVESRGVQMYDVIILLLVAAISVILARRINLMQDTGTSDPFSGQD